MGVNIHDISRDTTIRSVFEKNKIVNFIDTLIFLILTAIVLMSQNASDFSFLCLKIMFALIFIRILINRNIVIPEKTILVLILLFILVQVISSLVSEYPKESLYFVRVRATYYVIFFASLLFIKDLKQLKTILLALMIFASVISVIELGYYVNELITLRTSPANYRLDVFGHPTPIAETKMFVLLIIAPLLFIKEKFIISRLWLLILSIPIFISFYFTYTRGALLGFLVAVIIISLFNKKVIALIILILFSAFLILAPNSLKSRILSSADANFSSNKARIYMFETGFRMAEDHPLFGIGSAKFRDEYQKYRKITITGEGEHLHNNMLQILVTMGVFGLLMWLALMIYFFKRQISIFKRLKGQNVLRCLALSSFVSMIAFQICGITDWNFADYSIVTLFMFTLSLSFLAEKFQV